jgi:hypothetical protein
MKAQIPSPQGRLIKIILDDLRLRAKLAAENGKHDAEKALLWCASVIDAQAKRGENR